MWKRLQPFFVNGLQAWLWQLSHRIGLPPFTPWRFVAGLVGLLGLVSALYGFGLFDKPRRMTGEFTVAVAAFEELGDLGDAEVGYSLAQNVYERMESELVELSEDYIIQVWGPADVGSIEGRTPEQRARRAARKATDINAHIIVYGLVNITGSTWSITPEFYISDQDFFDAQEITGRHELGQPFEAAGNWNTATRADARAQLSARAEILSYLTVGLSRYVNKDFDQALRIFQEAEQDTAWLGLAGKELIYLLIGNAAGKGNDLDRAEDAYRNALALNPKYARAYVGLGSIYYMRALQPANLANNPRAIDVDLIELSIAHLERAASAADHPEYSDIATKVHFGLGQAYLALHLQDTSRPVDKVVREFEAVIADYNDGDNPRVRELAAEAHGNLGLIADLDHDRDTAIAEYERAVAMLEDSPERRNRYNQRLQELIARE